MCITLVIVNLLKAIHLSKRLEQTYVLPPDLLGLKSCPSLFVAWRGGWWLARTVKFYNKKKKIHLVRPSGSVYASSGYVAPHLLPRRSIYRSYWPSGFKTDENPARHSLLLIIIHLLSSSLGFGLLHETNLLLLLLLFEHYLLLSLAPFFFHE